MFRYMAVIWNAESRDQSEFAGLIGQKLMDTRPQWQRVFACRGVSVFCSDVCAGRMDARVLGTSGAILGSLFRRSTEEQPSEPATLSHSDIKAILNSRGTQLSQSYWGNYVAIVADPESQKCTVFKDPTGNLPCFYTQTRGVTVVFSCLTDCISLRLHSFTINWSHVARRVASGGFISDQTSLAEVGHVSRGQAVVFNVGGGAVASKSLYWRPLDFSRGDAVIENSDEALSLLRRTVRSTTHTLAKPHSSIVLRLSGGLDSSIVLGCLGRAAIKPDVLAYTYYNPRGSSDERRWARLAVQHTPCKHVEVPFDPAQIDLTQMLEIAPAVEPAPALMYLTRKAIERRLALRNGSTAILSGDGGDSSLGSESRGLAADEYLRRHGLRWKLFSLATQVAVIDDASLWGVLASIARRWAKGYRITDYRGITENASLVAAGVQENVIRQTEFPHPWFSGCEEVPWETIHRLGALMFSPEYYDPFVAPQEFGLEHLAPLYSQPLVELCLRIPTYVHFIGGRDRGLARTAFVAEVPEAILRRQWKDRAPGFAQELAHRNLEFLREMLLNGYLVQERLLDRKAVEAALSGQLSKSEAVIAEIFNNLDTELWLRSIHSTNSQKIAA